MSKVDALRAMREARYAANRARGPAVGSAAPASVAPAAPSPGAAAPAKKAPARRPAKSPAEPAPAEVATGGSGEVAAEQLCGHKNMTGKACRRPAGHPEKNHRYS